MVTTQMGLENAGVCNNNILSDGNGIWWNGAPLPKPMGASINQDIDPSK